MIMINNVWESVENLKDALKIIEAVFARELYEKIEKIIEEKLQDKTDDISDLISEIDELNIQMNDYDDLQSRIEELEDSLNSLNRYYDDNSDGSDYSSGLARALSFFE